MSAEGRENEAEMNKHTEGHANKQIETDWQTDKEVIKEAEW